MPKLGLVSFSSGEISPSLGARVDLQRFVTSLGLCSNWRVMPQGGISNRPGFEFVYALNPASLARLMPFVRSEDDAYMVVAQEENAQVFRDGAYIQVGALRTITDVTYVAGPPGFVNVSFTSVAHGFTFGSPVTIAGITDSFNFEPNGSFTINSGMAADWFRIDIPIASAPSGAYSSGGTAESPVAMVTPYQSDELSGIWYTQSADVMTLVHQGYTPSEIVRTSPTAFSFAAITDITTGPFLEVNKTATTVTVSATTGTGITITASTSIFNANHVGSLFQIFQEDLSALAPWETAKAVIIGDRRRYGGRVYEAANAATTGSVPPTHDEGIELDGDGGVEWEYIHSLYGIAKITAQAGTTATANVLNEIPFSTPATSTKWAFGAWSEDQGYPGCVTYFGDRLVFASTLEETQTQWASKTGDYHNFLVPAPQTDTSPITQTLNSRQTNAIVDMIPMDQLVSVTAKTSFSSPKRGEAWSANTVGFDQATFGGARLRALIIGEEALIADKGAKRIRRVAYDDSKGKYTGVEISVLARHIFGSRVVDWDYAENPDGIVYMCLEDGQGVGLTYLPEQDVIAFWRLETDGYFENVAVIPEFGIDTPYFVIRRSIGGSDVRYLERLVDRSEDTLDAFYVDSGLTYDGRNTTATTMTVSGASYEGGDSVTITASASSFASTDVGDAIQLGGVTILITAYTSVTVVTGTLQTPLTADYQATATATWTFARDTFSGLGHLEGETITGLADGNVIDADDTTTAGVVTSGQIVLNNPAGVVHIGLPYTCDAETLNLNVAGGSQIMDHSKIVSKVSFMVLNSTGIKIGRNSESLEEMDARSFENYTDPASLQTGMIVAYPQALWNKSSKIFIRQDYPKPATVLAIIPTATIGHNG